MTLENSIIGAALNAADCSDPDSILHALDEIDGVSCEIFKRPRPMYHHADSLIIQLHDGEDVYCLKIYPNAFVYADQIYNDAALSDTMAERHYMPKIHHVYTTNDNYRAVLYDYHEGQRLDSVLENITASDLDQLKSQFKDFVRDMLMETGLSPIISDTSNYIIRPTGDIVLLDMDALRDVRNTTQETREQYFELVLSKAIDTHLRQPEPKQHPPSNVVHARENRLPVDHTRHHISL